MVFILLDTNILQWQGIQGKLIYDNTLPVEDEQHLADKYGPAMVEELLSLRDVIHVAQRGSLPIAISEISLREFLNTKDPTKRGELANWALEMLDWWNQNRDFLVDPNKDVDSIRSEILQSGKLSFLPHEGDRALVAEALSLGCDTLLTLDKKSIIRFQAKLMKLGLDGLTPSEFVQKYGDAMAGA